CRLAIRRWAFAPGNSLGQAAVLDQFHAEITLALVLANLVDGHNVRMVETGGCLSFGTKALHFGWSRQVAGQNHLKRHQPVQTHLSRPINHPHAATCDFPQQLVIAEKAGRGNCALRTGDRSGRRRVVVYESRVQAEAKHTLWTAASQSGAGERRSTFPACSL